MKTKKKMILEIESNPNLYGKWSDISEKDVDFLEFVINDKNPDFFAKDKNSEEPLKNKENNQNISDKSYEELLKEEEEQALNLIDKNQGIESNEKVKKEKVKKPKLKKEKVEKERNKKTKSLNHMDNDAEGGKPNLTNKNNNIDLREDDKEIKGTTQVSNDINNSEEKSDVIPWYKNWIIILIIIIITIVILALGLGLGLGLGLKGSHKPISNGDSWLVIDSKNNTVGIDTDKDGRTDIELEDSDNDGMNDVNIIAYNNALKEYGKYGIDTNGDNVPEDSITIIKTNNTTYHVLINHDDLIPDLAFIDINNDGELDGINTSGLLGSDDFDILLVDTDGDGNSEMELTDDIIIEFSLPEEVHEEIVPSGLLTLNGGEKVGEWSHDLNNFTIYFSEVDSLIKEMTILPPNIDEIYNWESVTITGSFKITNYVANETENSNIDSWKKDVLEAKDVVLTFENIYDQIIKFEIGEFYYEDINIVSSVLGDFLITLPSNQDVLEAERFKNINCENYLIKNIDTYAIDYHDKVKLSADSYFSTNLYSAYFKPIGIEAVENSYSADNINYGNLINVQNYSEFEIAVGSGHYEDFYIDGAPNYDSNLYKGTEDFANHVFNVVNEEYNFNFTNNIYFDDGTFYGGGEKTSYVGSERFLVS